MASTVNAIGIDFGTSNSAAGILRDGKPQLIQMTPGKATIPTTFFFDFDTRETLIGEPANQALLGGHYGRFMRALKRVLGTSVMHEKRQLLNERVTFVDIIGRFLARIKSQAEVETGLTFDCALSGRPVVFHGADAAKEARAEADLRACYQAAGFEQVAFMAEPEAAAIANGVLEHSGEIGLIVDIGGGTSDFSLFRTGREGAEILANHGVRIGGTDFDRTISIDRIMPLLGRGTKLRKQFGPGDTPVPSAIYNDLATWEKIPYLYTPQNLRIACEMAQLAHAPERMRRLVHVLSEELGHELAFAAERGKIAANSGEGGASIDLDLIEPGLSAELTASVITQILTTQAAQLREVARETLARAGFNSDQVNRVIYVGGSSLMAVVPDTMRRLFSDAEHSFSEVFTAVADGLAIAADATFAAK